MVARTSAQAVSSRYRVCAALPCACTDATRTTDFQRVAGRHQPAKHRIKDDPRLPAPETLQTVASRGATRHLAATGQHPTTFRLWLGQKSLVAQQVFMG